ncbi:hypothetical protein [Acaryochloris sp. IP29b_bin.137]|uniref:hypothetical protein n=1 Tax=Acaryochloris sp. IP29b_bin.137 TaxID=2969217 RepID=UPI0026136EA6|nr:hypothetical protein [Acaryochloris sp. IP29b_bin.137]
MSLFTSSEYYSPILVLLVGIVSLIGYLGLGLTLQDKLSLSLPHPWKQVVGVLLGLQVASLIVQILGMANLASRPLLIIVWSVMIVISWSAVIKHGIVQKRWPLSIFSSGALLPLIIILIGIGINLIVAIAPSSKIDELYYHMLLPSRIIADGSLKFYQEPWLAAIYPQMIFQMSTTLLYSLGLPDAGNVVSWGLSVLLVYFGLSLAHRQHETPSWRHIWLVPMALGLYPVVWHVTGGAHAMGDLATAAATVALLDRKRLLQEIGPQKFAIVSSLLVLSSISTKVSLLPLGCSLLILTLFFLFQQVLTFTQRLKVFLYALMPWGVFYLPILTWTFWQSGSPFGPVLANVFYKSVYDVDALSIRIHESRIVNTPTIKDVLILIVRNYWPLSSLALLCLICLVLIKSIPKMNRWIILFLFSFQTLIILKLMFFDLRFYGGLLHGYLIYFVMVCPQKLANRLVGSLPKNIIVMGLFLAPSLLVQIYYSLQFFPVILGIQSKVDFYRDKIPFYDDYQALDRLLPKNSVLLVSEKLIRLSSVYSPRPVYFTLDDVPPLKPVYLFLVKRDSNSNPHVKQAKQLLPLDKLQLGDEIYQNENAVIQTYRTPGRTNSIGSLIVYPLLNN